MIPMLELEESLFRFVLVLMRCSGLVVFCPILSSRMLPRRMRVGLAVALAVVLLPLVPAPAALDAGAAAWTLVAVRELAVGFALGIAARVTFDGIEGAARIIAGQSGFSLSSMVDPLTGSQSSAPAMFQGLTGTALFLAADLHHLFIRGLVHSYDLLPTGAQLPAHGQLQTSVAVIGGRMFAIAVELAAPGLIVCFAVDLVLVLAGRAMSQIPVLIVGYPLKVAGGLVALLLTCMATASAMPWIGRTLFSDAAALLAAFGSR